MQSQASEAGQESITEDEAFIKVLGPEKSSRLRACGDGLKPPSKRGERINDELIKENEELRKQAEEDRECLESLKKDNKEMYKRLQTLESQVNNQEVHVHSQVQAIIKSQLPTIIQNLSIFGQIHQPANGQYIWNVLPMGLANAPQIFQRKIDNLFKDYFEFMFVYIDDILIASKNMKDHIKHLEIFSDALEKDHIVEKIHNFSDVLKKHLQSFLGVVNFAGIFIKDLAKYRKDFRPLLKEIKSSKWKWEEIHTQRVRELKQVCNNLPKLVIPQDEYELVVYTDANDYRWAAVLMKKTATGEEPCRYTEKDCSQNNKPKCGISMTKNSLQYGRPLRNDLYSYLLRVFKV
ncbi:UNVERIFIED_CONTAM: Polyprotein P3 [Sesamum latifolium]|uniref:Polyprotein P3 n=1 Tax=Sesamum latifolium TaxID=2727402 RepID=A0AAW2SRF0_9LAMI